MSTRKSMGFDFSVCDMVDLAGDRIKRLIKSTYWNQSGFSTTRQPKWLFSSIVKRFDGDHSSYLYY